MRGIVEQSTHPKVRLEVRTPRILVGPSGSQRPGGLVELHDELELPSERLAGSVLPGQSLGRGPVSTGVLAKLRGVDACQIAAPSEAL